MEKVQLNVFADPKTLAKEMELLFPEFHKFFDKEKIKSQKKLTEFLNTLKEDFSLQVKIHSALSVVQLMQNEKGFLPQKELRIFNLLKILCSFQQKKLRAEGAFFAHLELLLKIDGYLRLIYLLFVCLVYAIEAIYLSQTKEPKCSTDQLIKEILGLEDSCFTGLPEVINRCSFSNLFQLFPIIYDELMPYDLAVKEIQFLLQSQELTEKTIKANYASYLERTRKKHQVSVAHIKDIPQLFFAFYIEEVRKLYYTLNPSKAPTNFVLDEGYLNGLKEKFTSEEEAKAASLNIKFGKKKKEKQIKEQTAKQLISQMIKAEGEKEDVKGPTDKQQVSQMMNERGSKAKESKETTDRKKMPQILKEMKRRIQEREKTTFKRPGSQLIRARKGQSSERRELAFQMNKLIIDKGRKGKSNEVKEQLDNQKEPKDIKQKEGKTNESKQLITKSQETLEKTKPQEVKGDDGKEGMNQLQELPKMKSEEYAEVNQSLESKQIKPEEENINQLSQIIKTKEEENFNYGENTTELTLIKKKPSEQTPKETPMSLLQTNLNETHNGSILQEDKNELLYKNELQLLKIEIEKMKKENKDQVANQNLINNQLQGQIILLENNIKLLHFRKVSKAFLVALKYHSRKAPNEKKKFSVLVKKLIKVKEKARRKCKINWRGIKRWKYLQIEKDSFSALCDIFCDLIEKGNALAHLDQKYIDALNEGKLSQKPLISSCFDDFVKTLRSMQLLEKHKDMETDLQKLFQFFRTSKVLIDFV